MPQWVWQEAAPQAKRLRPSPLHAIHRHAQQFRLRQSRKIRLPLIRAVRESESVVLLGLAEPGVVVTISRDEGGRVPTRFTDTEIRAVEVELGADLSPDGFQFP